LWAVKLQRSTDVKFHEEGLMEILEEVMSVALNELRDVDNKGR
jgi:hypothetical protein